MLDVSSARDISLMRIIAQGLVEATASADPAAAVGGMLAIQGQQVGAVPHALLSRTPLSTTARDVDAAFESGALVKSWPMRGTVHVTRAEDHHWMRQALRHRTGGWLEAVDRVLANLGGLEAVSRCSLDVVAQAQAQGRAGATRAELAQCWEDAGYIAALEAHGQATWGMRRRLLVALHMTGVLVQGPRRGNEHLLVSAQDLPDETTGPGGAGGCAQGQPGHEAALVEIARRYALGHGPVSAEDMARWTTLPLTQCRKLLEAALERGDAASDMAGSPDGSGAVGLMRAQAPGTGTTVYMRADLPDLLTQHRAAASRTLFLASFDELHVGYKDRSCLTDAAGERLICPAANGMFRPLVVDKGRVVAVCPVGEGLIWDERVRLSARLERDVERARKKMKSRLAA